LRKHGVFFGSMNIPVFIINLKRSSDRRDHTIRQLNDLGITFQIIEAVDGNSLSDHDLTNTPSFGIYKNLIYMNHNIATNPAKRTEVYTLLKDKPWITVDMKHNGDDFDSYLDNIYNHKFVICPEGNGIDTHRLWEALYMGTIPIVLRSNNTEHWRGLKYATVGNWAWVDVDFVTNVCSIFNSEYFEEMDEMLTFDYWKNKILSYKDGLDSGK